MCRIETHVVSGPDGRQQIIETTHRCGKSRDGRLCSTVVINNGDNTFNRSSVFTTVQNQRDPQQSELKREGENLRSGAPRPEEEEPEIDPWLSDGDDVKNEEDGSSSPKSRAVLPKPAWGNPSSRAKLWIEHEQRLDRSTSSAPNSAYFSARSEAFHSAVSSLHPSNEQRKPAPPQQKTTEYIEILRQLQLWPVNPEDEQNWSGRGQHVEFQQNKKERQFLGRILSVEDLLGSTSSAIVQSVRCKRILLARKTISCNRNMTRDKAIEEVAHLNRLSHAHVVRVIGTYVIGQELSILLYPVAEWNLETFLQVTSGHLLGPQRRRQLLPKFMVCLVNTLAFIHQSMTKHMDIKPKNILVKGKFPGEVEYRVYIADFGIARAYTSLEAAETEGPTMFTRKYAAPEVVDFDKRGFPADIFSMGCVFTEMIADYAIPPDAYQSMAQDPFFNGSLSKPPTTTELTVSLSSLRGILKANGNGDTSYQANVDAVRGFLDTVYSEVNSVGPRPYSVRPERFKDFIEVTKAMISVDPSRRPSAAELVEKWGTNPCCTKGPEPLAAVLAL
ncbi:kinase-like protein [Lentithecium fluviatile CBS 122367]|uniref:Kinase-like protein n=1 Tax=Lentithecium fluviatile CBS 122367 TaxID=1168545 RepID=A0A6G1J267_9PLEO|nr:kinase-like protein [Lentithecium fluviatile CBS 122367]